MYGFRTEPVIVSGLLAAAFAFAIEWFGVNLTQGMQTSAQGLVAALFLLFARSQVISPATAAKALNTPDGVGKIAEAAANPNVTLVAKTGPVLLAILMLGACSSNPVPTARPDAYVAQAAKYGAQAVDYVTAAQKIVNTYTVAQGGRTPVTDKISAAIRDQVIPQAERLRTAFNVYAVASDTVAKSAAIKDLQTQLDLYEQLVEDVLERDVPEGLTKQLVTTVYDIRELINNVRDAFLSGGVANKPVAEHERQRAVVADLIQGAI